VEEPLAMPSRKVNVIAEHLADFLTMEKERPHQVPTFMVVEDSTLAEPPAHATPSKRESVTVEVHADTLTEMLHQLLLLPHAEVSATLSNVESVTVASRADFLTEMPPKVLEEDTLLPDDPTLSATLSSVENATAEIPADTPMMLMPPPLRDSLHHLEALATLSSVESATAETLAVSLTSPRKHLPAFKLASMVSFDSLLVVWAQKWVFAGQKTCFSGWRAPALTHWIVIFD